MNISTHLPDLVDQYISFRAQRLAVDKKVAELKEMEESLKKAIIAKMKDESMSAVGGANGLVKMTVLREPVANDWSALYDFIKANDAFELLHKRLSTVAVKERADDGEILPGIGWTDVYKLSVSKA